MQKIDKPLKYDANRIIGVHGLKRGLDCEILNVLLNSTDKIEPEHLSFLETHRHALCEYGTYWDDAALKMNFLAHVFYVAQLRVDKKN